MAVVLEGGCRVSTMHEGVPRVFGSLKIWNQIGKASGAEAISLRILEFGPGSIAGLRNRECDEVLYLLEILMMNARIALFSSTETLMKLAHRPVFTFDPDKH